MQSNNSYKGIDKILILIVRKKAKQLSYSKYFLNSDLEDLEQELMADLLVQISIYNPPECTIYRFAKVVVENKSCRLVRLMLRQQFDNLSLLEEQEILDPIKYLEQDMAVKSAIGEDNDKFVELYSLLQFFSLQEIAEQKNISYFKLYRNLQKLRQILKDAGLYK
ncbi:MAG: sigma-70 family RNA polymerase sigma factor [Rickettsiaceae bacterium]|nr:sigma-70 family RNA polymerase sigma factor [Rickettsiaceae bacterium]